MENMTTGRLESLDVLRGFDMFFIFLPDPVPCIVFTFCAMMGWEHSAFAAQFDHCAWNGLRFYDCIFPLFLFISGVTFPFSYAKQVARGMTRAQSVRRVLVRAFLLFLLGAMLWTTTCSSDGRRASASPRRYWSGCGSSCALPSRRERRRG